MLNIQMFSDKEREEPEENKYGKKEIFNLKMLQTERCKYSSSTACQRHIESALPAKLKKNNKIFMKGNWRKTDTK